MLLHCDDKGILQTEEGIMILINKKTKNMVEKRVIYMKEFPENCDLENDPKLKFRWAALKYVQYDRVGTKITISKEQAEKSTVLAVSDVISSMGWNIDKVEYYVNNSELNAKITVWEECMLGKKSGYPSVRKSVVLVEDDITGKKFYSCNDDGDDGTYDTVSKEIFPSYCIVKCGSIALDYLDAKGKLPPSDELKLKETDFDPDSIIKQRIKKPEVVYTNEIKITRNEYDTTYIPMTDSNFTSCDAESRVRQSLLFDESSHFDTVNLTDSDAPVLTVEKDHDLYSIGIIDELNGTVHYYNNGDTSGEYTELNGETYPNFMITSDMTLVLSVIKYFVEHEKPYDKIQWISEEV